MDSRGSSIMGRASSSEDSTSNHDELDRSQSYQNHFFDALRKNPDMGEILDEVSEEEKTAYYTSTTTSRLPTSSTISYDRKESDNEDVIFIPSTNSEKIQRDAPIINVASNPFQFGIKTKAADMNKNLLTSDSSHSQENTLLTINTITSLLKQLQELVEQEKRLLTKTQSSDDSVSPDREILPKPVTDTRKKNRPQLLMKKMKGMLSASNLGAKNDDNILISSQKISEKDADNNEVPENKKVALKRLRLQKLHMSLETMQAVDGLRGTISEHMPGVVRRRARQCSSVSPSPSINGISSEDELPLLLGRCFNLSVNLKILKQCNYADPAIGCRVFVDFDVLENYLNQKIQECQTSLNINDTDNQKYLLCPKQLETKINSLSIANHNVNIAPDDNIQGCM